MKERGRRDRRACRYSAGGPAVRRERFEARASKRANGETVRENAAAERTGDGTKWSERGMLSMNPL
ncbi:hypothetical protein DMJ13_15065 [halophilic archaeon]|nr:hypothetical protein DMJ13_15065 [halophilic archaeon]